MESVAEMVPPLFGVPFRRFRLLFIFQALDEQLHHALTLGLSHVDVWIAWWLGSLHLLRLDPNLAADQRAVCFTISTVV